MPIPKIVHQTSKHLTANEFRLARRLQTVMPEWEYRLWTDADNHMLVQQHFPQYFPMFSSIKRGVVKADIARYMYMAVHGGFYCDTDYKMFRPLDEQLLEHKCILPLSRNSEECFRIGNAVFASSPEHPFWFDFLAHLFNGREIKSCVENLAEDRIEKVTGPEGLTEFYLAHREHYTDIWLAPTPYFHPSVGCKGLRIARTAQTYGAHLCWGSWRTKSPFTRAIDTSLRVLASFV